MWPGKGTLKFVVVEIEKEIGGQTTLEVHVVPEVWRNKEGQRCFLYPSHYSSS